MIEINKIDDIPFPAIDFKFINRGNCAAFLWRVGLEVLDAKIDPTPDLKFSYKILPETILFTAENEGWGNALSTQLTFSEELIDHLFSIEQRSCKCDITTGVDQEIHRLPFSAITYDGITYIHTIIKKRKKLIKELPKAMQEGNSTILNHPDLNRVLCDHERWHLNEFFDDLKQGKNIDDPRQQWHIAYITDIDDEYAPVANIQVNGGCKDESNVSQSINQEIIFGTYNYGGRGQLWISPKEFNFERYSPPLLCYMGPTILAVMLIDPHNTSPERFYPMSISIPAGEPERFLLFIASPISCHVQIRCNFYLDGGQVINSEPMDLSIWQPRNKEFHVTDGLQFIKSGDKWVLADEKGFSQKDGFRELYDY